MELTKIGRRYYFRGAPYSEKNTLKGAGCRWDPAERAWWTGKKALAEALLTKISSGRDGDSRRDETVATSAAIIKGRVAYKGRTYYLLAERRDGTAVKVCFRDGSKTFWTKQEVGFEVLKRYQTPKSIDSLRAYAQQVKDREDGIGIASDWCGERHGGRCCPTGGNCSSMGSGRSCGAYCCDGY